MAEYASNEIMCVLQSDMVVSKDFDKEILKNLNKKHKVVSIARIEPPLHPPSNDKIIEDLGKTPEDFNFKKFNDFVETVKDNEKITQSFFAPFACYTTL